MHSVNTNGDAADREERQEILHHDDTDQPTEKEGKEGSEEGGVCCGGRGGGERWGEGRWRRERQEEGRSLMCEVREELDEGEGRIESEERKERI